MSGIQEITLIAVLILAILYLPRLVSGKRAVSSKASSLLFSLRRLSGSVRLALVGSFLWIFIAAVLIKPWNEQLMMVLYLGIAPVIIAWSIWWVILGFRRK
ncbi:MAG: hypothetical protein RRA35_08695 [Desulfomonilia bacterium]|nr:hypothetical protein [Desulfomonilia bacterium]